MSPFQHAVDTFLSALRGEAAVAEGVLLCLAEATVIRIERQTGPVPRAVLTFDPPPELKVRRGPIHLRCRLPKATVSGDEIHLAIDGWFDQRFPVT